MENELPDGADKYQPLERRKIGREDRLHTVSTDDQEILVPFNAPGHPDRPNLAAPAPVHHAAALINKPLLAGPHPPGTQGGEPPQHRLDQGHQQPVLHTDPYSLHTDPSLAKPLPPSLDTATPLATAPAPTLSPSAPTPAPSPSPTTTTPPQDLQE